MLLSKNSRKRSRTQSWNKKASTATASSRKKMSTMVPQNWGREERSHHPSRPWPETRSISWVIPRSSSSTLSGEWRLIPTPSAALLA